MVRHQGYIQPILVARGGTHEDTVAAAAVASVRAWLTLPAAPSWEPWLSSAFAKTVRRARPVEIERASPLLVSRVEVGASLAVAGVPYLTDGLPPEIAKTQVTGTDFDRTGSWPVLGEDPSGPAPTLVINADAGMSTGKAAAQAAHGLFGWALTQPQSARDAWAAAGFPLFISEAASSEFKTLERAHRGGVVIRDAGFTEIAPGTATVIAYTPGRDATNPAGDIGGAGRRYNRWTSLIGGLRRR